MKCQAGSITNWNHDCQKSIKNLRYVDDSTLIAENEEPKSLLMIVKEARRVKEESGLKFIIKNTNIIASGLTTS